MAKNITKKDLEQMGIIFIGSKSYPYKFFIPQVGEVNLYEPYKWEEIFQKIYDSGFAAGSAHGENKKVQELKKVLQIED